MNICYLADAGSVHTQRWIGYFARQGHEVHLISLRAPGAPLDGIRLHPLQVMRPRAGAQLPGAARGALWAANLLPVVLQVRRTLRAIGPDVVHAHSVSDYGFLAAAAGASPLMLTAWGSDVLIAPTRSAWQRRAVQLALRRAARITCDAHHLVERMVELGAAREAIRVIFFGTDTEKFHPGARDGELKRRFGWQPDDIVIISARTLAPLYDVGSLVRAAPAVLREAPAARFVIAGGGEQRDELEALARSLGVAGAVAFTGMVPAAELPRTLASADIYVSTALSDAGLSASTSEAMACGLPAVITDFGDNAEWVGEGQGGFLVPLSSPAALADKIIYLAQHPAVRAEFGRVNRRTIEQRNSVGGEMAKVGECYRQLAKDAT